jgi:glucose-6-phosphate isomerase
MKTLNQLAKTPADLTKNLTPDRLEKLKAEALGMKLLYGTERVTEEVMDALWQMAQEKKVLHHMEKMQKGEIVNTIAGVPCENRPALHTAMRDLFSQAPRAAEATQLARQEIEKLKKFYPRFTHFTDLVQIGIGGSSLGPQAICLGLEAFHKPGKRVHFISNVDPDETTKIFKALDLKKTVVVVVSKSGSTLETVTNEARARQLFESVGLPSKDHVIAVTGKGSPMDDPQKYLSSFYIWDYIGGRYSVTSMVGAVMLAFVLGIDALMEFLQGAHEMDTIALSSDPAKNLPLISALLGVWNRNYLNLPTVAIIPYSQALSRFPAHLQQLDMESNGKRIDKSGKAVDFETGPIIWGEPGTNGQHSFFQLIHQGTTVVPLEIVAFKETQYGEDLEVQGTTSQEKLLANLFAQSIALAQGEKSDNPNKFFPGNRPNRILLARRLDPFTIGALLAYYEHKVVFQGFLWNINSFDQEGVQLGKTLASKIINLFKKQGNFPLGEAYLKQL